MNVNFLNIFSLFIQLNKGKVPVGSGSGDNFPDLTKKIRIRNPGWNGPWLVQARRQPDFCSLQISIRMENLIWDKVLVAN